MMYNLIVPCIRYYKFLDPIRKYHQPYHINFFQGELIIIANVGDSWAVLGTTSDDGSLIPFQLTVDFKPNLPR